MKIAKKITAALVTATMMTTPLMAQEKIKMATIAPGSSAYLVMTTMAMMVNSNQDDYEISVDATGVATSHMVEAAQGKLDVVMSSPIIYDLMRDGTGMFNSLKSAPGLSQNLGLMFWFPYGAFHVVTQANSGISNLDDIRGKRVFLGPPGGGAYRAAVAWIAATTGMEPGTDYTPIKAEWGAGLQGFKDQKYDVYISGGIAPFAQIEQLSETMDIRLLGLSRNQADSVSRGENAPIQKLVTQVGHSMDVIPRNSYGRGVLNDRDVYTLGSLAGFVARLDLSEDAVYAMTKTFWENLSEVTASETYMQNVNLDTAFGATNMRLHPGALKYYREVGVNVPAEMQ